MNSTSKNILLVVVLAAIGLGVIWLTTYGGEEVATENEVSEFAAVLSAQDEKQEQEAQPAQQFTVLEGWRVYQNTERGFLLAYPSNMKGRQVNEGGGAVTLAFENIEKALGFQMFIVPYDEPAITEERFKQDIPSGVRENVEKVFIDGTEGVAFDSEDGVLGPTKEVWFIRDGYLYEVTAPKSQERLLSDVLLTLDFVE